ncbi:MAG: hypothetical protein HDR71_19815 [Lachnospiraceae bacterium]|nr:hypothetical protein [Lachnospiraceae bacterium]
MKKHKKINWRNLIKKIRLFIHNIHLYNRKGEALAKTIIFWISMIFGLQGITDSSDTAVKGSGFLMFALAMIIEYAFSAIERKSYTKILPMALAFINSYITIISASYFTKTPYNPYCVTLMDLTLISLAIITIDSIMLLVEDADGLENKEPLEENPDKFEEKEDR